MGSPREFGLTGCIAGNNAERLWRSANGRRAEKGCFVYDVVGFYFDFRDDKTR
jgi:hypothetical protein